MRLWVVFADHRFCGLYRSLAAANRLKAKLDNLAVDWGLKPAVVPVDEVVEGITCFVGAFAYMHEAIECGWYGRSKYAL